MEEEFSFYSRPIKNLITTTNSVSSQIAINDKYAASYLSLPDANTMANEFYQYLLSFMDSNHVFLTKKLKFQSKLVLSCLVWRTLFKPSLIASLQLLKKFVNSYTDTFPELEQLIHANDRQALNLLNNLSSQLWYTKISFQVTEYFEKKFTRLINSHYDELQSSILPKLNSIITTQSSCIEKLSNDLILNQANIDALEKKITEINASLVALEIALTISIMTGGNIFIVLAELISITALTVTEVGLHERLNGYKQKNQSILNEIKNKQRILVYFTHIKQHFITLAETFKQTTNFFSSYKNALYDTVSKFNILLDKIKTVENKLENEKYYFLKAALTDMNKEFTLLKNKLQEKSILYDIPIRKLNQPMFSKHFMSPMPNRLYFQYKLNEITLLN